MTPCCEKNVIRGSSGGDCGESVYVALKVGVSSNKADILARSPISKVGLCKSTFYLVSHVITPEL